VGKIGIRKSIISRTERVKNYVQKFDIRKSIISRTEQVKNCVPKLCPKHLA